MKRYKLWIGEKFVHGHGRLESKNPADGKVLATFDTANESDVENAVNAAEKALLSWSETPAPKRGAILLDIARLLKEEKEILARAVCLEMGKVLPEARGDVQEAIDVFEYMAGEGRRLFGHTTPSELKEKACYTLRRPIGVVGIISSWNFPIAVPAWKISAALVCGNTIVFKPSSETPLCGHLLAEICRRAGLPKGVLNVLVGSGESVGKFMVQHPRVRGISFTGSKETGEWILKNAGVKRVGLELGGKNAIIVMDDADLKLAVEGILWGAFGTTGQRCTAASRAIVHEKVAKKLEKMLLKKVKRLRLGPGTSTRTDVGPLINKAAVEKCQRFVEIGKREGAKLLCGGNALKRKGHFFAPTIFSNVKPNMRIAREEIFGPILSIIPVNSLKQAIQTANCVEYGLSSAIYTSNMRNAFNAIQGIEAGITYVNSSTIGAEVHLPFGGVKGSGNTREAGILGIDEFSEVKTVYWDYSGKLQKAQIDSEKKK